ncbi:MAG: hypothetical protein J6K82_01635 [Alphaproteobacteria bacterium]|nr:hypothetical protein [Alphaproteobacteria bacterium]
MTKKEILENAKKVITDTLRGTAYGVILTSAAISATGLVGHYAKFLNAENIKDYSLTHRFETMYCFDVPTEHQYYHEQKCNYQHIGQHNCYKQKYYIANAYLTYLLIAGGAALGATTGGIKSIINQTRQNKHTV